MNIIKNCLLCNNSIPDPEMGYSCGIEKWDCFANNSDVCSKFSLNKCFAIDKAIRFFENGEQLSNSKYGKETYTMALNFYALAVEGLKLLKQEKEVINNGD